MKFSHQREMKDRHPFWLKLQEWALRFRPWIRIPVLCRVMLLLILGISIDHLVEEEPPWNSAWGRKNAEGVSPTFREHVATGQWYAAIARTGIAALLLAVSPWWLRNPPSTIPLAAPTPLRRAPIAHPRLYGCLFALILLSAVTLRLPRMDHSYWGDEEDAIATYVHGIYSPTDKDDRQGSLYFKQATWQQTFFGARHGPNNHVLFSIASRLCLSVWRHLEEFPETAISEVVSRIPSLAGGLASLVTLALVTRHYGFPWTGLLAVGLMSMHPWHLRYSTEARGYALALALLPLVWLAASGLRRRGSWPAWLLFALLQTAVMHTWAGMVYLLAATNAILVAGILGTPSRFQQGIRWLTANLLAAGAFISLYAPLLPQIAEAKERLGWLKGLPMDAVWFHNLLAETMTGIPFHSAGLSNPEELTWQTLWPTSPWITTSGFGLLLLALITGPFRLWMRSREAALLVLGSIAAALLCALHFKFVIGLELRTWYLVFLLPAGALSAAAGFEALASRLCRRAPRLSAPMAIGMAAVTLAAVWPMNSSQIRLPYEDFKSVAALTRSPHETFDPDTPSKVHVCWLWRYAKLYDARGDFHVRNGPELQERIQLARSRQEHLYVVVGFEKLARFLNADMLALLEDETLFSRVHTAWSRDSIHTLKVYRLLPEVSSKASP
jgi:hypothetical protein